MVGDLPGVPTSAWLREHRLLVCRGCRKLMIIGTAGGWHRKCWAKNLRDRTDVAEEATRVGVRPEAPDGDSEGGLPSLEDIAAAPITTLEHVPEDVLAAVDVEYRRLLANVVLFNMEDAWQGGGRWRPR